MARWLKAILLLLLPVAALGTVEWPRAGLILHLDAGAIRGVANNAPLSAGWADQSGSGVIASGATPPQFIADAGGGYPSVRFEGTGQYLQANVPTGGDVTVFVVFAYRRLLAGWPDYRETLVTTSSASSGLSLASSYPVSTSPDYPAFNASPVTGGTVQTWVDGRDTAYATGEILNGRFYVGSAVFTNLPAAGSLFIGSRDATGAQSGKNDIREILVYNRALSEEERCAVQRYLGLKYDIELVWRPLSHSVEAWPHTLGSQQFGNQYSFGQSGIRVLDYARSTLRQGSRVAKFRLSNKYASDDGFTAIAGIDSLTKLVRDHPEVKAVLDLPLTDYLFWTTTFAYPTWQNAGNVDAVGLKPEVQQAIYREIYDLAAYLLATYSGSGKRFYLGNWEGDWMLATGYTDPTQIPANRIQAMVDWANTRQRAIDDAKAATPHSNVQVWYYLEMNKADWMRDGLPCVANSVIPAMPKLDMISISSYSIHKDGGNLAATSRIYADLDRVQALINAKPDSRITGSRIIIGEYGWTYSSTSYASLTDFARQHLNTARAFLGWPRGTLRFILQWQYFNSVDASGDDVKEMSQIGPNNEIRPMYYFHENFYRGMRRWVDDYRLRTGAMPSARAYADQAYYLLGTLSLARYVPAIALTTYEAWRTRNFIDAAEVASLSVSGPKADPYGTGLSNLLRYGLSLSKLEPARPEIMPEVRFRGGQFFYAFPFDPSKSDLRWWVEATSSLTAWNLTLLDSATQSLPAESGWIEVGSGGLTAPGAPVFFRLGLQTTAGN